MSRWRRILSAMTLGRRAPEPVARDPAIASAAADSHEKAAHTYRLLSELRSRTEAARLNRARLIYDEGLYGRKGR